MNFVCDRCKAIRPFCGEPPKCGVCGWERNAASHQETNVLPGEQVWTGEQKVGLGVLLRAVIGGFALVAVVVVIVQFFLLRKHSDFQTPGKYRFALKYGLTEDEVFMDPKPAGCDFTDAPLGDKHCHFEPDVNVVRECLAPNCPVKRVYVSWHKVRDEAEKR